MWGTAEALTTARQRVFSSCTIIAVQSTIGELVQRAQGTIHRSFVRRKSSAVTILAKSAGEGKLIDWAVIAP